MIPVSVPKTWEDYGAEGRPQGQFASTALEQKRSPPGLRVKVNYETQKLAVKNPN
jgi:hypothetical protein